MSSKILLVAGAALALAGCNTVNKNIGMEDPGLGDAPKYDAAIQTIRAEYLYWNRRSTIGMRRRLWA